MSASESFIAKYRQAYVLSILQLASSVSTLVLYGLDEDVWSRVFQLLLIIYALCTILILHRMCVSTLSCMRRANLSCRLAYTRCADPTQSFSRVDTHHSSLIFVFWLSLNSINAWLLITAPTGRLSTVRAFCASSSFTPICIPLMMDFVLPVLIMIPVYSAWRALRRRAAEVYGTHPVAVISRDSCRETSVPAWLAPHSYVAGLLVDEDANGDAVGVKMGPISSEMAETV
ncbi:hypothetical protein B0H19DRAFT_1377452 [Mycena capillaripes]|nr:hypothetical protein B0H19DRAFT_1377452 [Mycena capillaripes]